MSVRGRASLLPVTLLALATLPAPGRAHDEPYSYLDLAVEADTVRGTVMAHVFDIANAALLTPPDSLLSPTYRALHHDAVLAVFAARLRVRLDGDSMHPTFEPGLEAVNDRRLLRARFWLARSAPGRIEVNGRLFPEDPQHETYLNIYRGGSLTHQLLLDRSHPTAQAFSRTSQGAWAVLRTFVVQGIHHIFIGPDHILFIVGLVLMGGGFARLFRIVTAFTIAHSITLALATLGVINPPSRIIEPLIALSIIAIGIENLIARGGQDRRVPLAFGFGLIHGFGFAGVLAEFGLPREALGISLFGFNLGVEIGQAVIVALIAPVLAALAARAPAASRRVITIGSAVVIAAGSYWLVQRLFAAS